MTEKKLLRLLLEHKVRFLVIGAWALPAHGYKRFTGDIDLFISPTKQNAARVKQALLELGYEVVRGTPIQTFLKTKVLIRQYTLETDIHPFVKGIEFTEAWENRIETEIEGVKVFVPSLHDLMKMKRAAGRAKDRLDLKELLKIERYNKTRGKFNRRN